MGAKKPRPCWPHRIQAARANACAYVDPYVFTVTMNLYDALCVLTLRLLGHHMNVTCTPDHVLCGP